MSHSDLALSVMLGIALAAASGFRVFLPMLVVSVAGLQRVACRSARALPGSRRRRRC